MVDVAARQIEEQLAARGLGSPALVHAGLEQMQLGLAQGALEPKQQTVVIGGRIVNAVSVSDQRVAQRADLQELMPVATGAGQTGHLYPEHQADPPQTNLGHQPLKARPPLGGGAGAAEIVINNGHALARPPEVERPINQPVLEAGRLMMALDLLKGGLADVDDGQPVKVGAADLLWYRSLRGRARHGPSPVPRLRPADSALQAGRPAPPTCVGVNGGAIVYHPPVADHGLRR